MIVFRHHFYDQWCDGAYNNKCWIFAAINIYFFKITEGTLFCEPSILLKSVCLSLGLQFLRYTIENFDLLFNMGGNLN